MVCLLLFAKRAFSLLETVEISKSKCEDYWFGLCVAHWRSLCETIALTLQTANEEKNAAKVHVMLTRLVGSCRRTGRRANGNGDKKRQNCISFSILFILKKYPIYRIFNKLKCLAIFGSVRLANSSVCPKCRI